MQRYLMIPQYEVGSQLFLFLFTESPVPNCPTLLPLPCATGATEESASDSPQCQPLWEVCSLSTECLSSEEKCGKYAQYVVSLFLIFNFQVKQ